MPVSSFTVVLEHVMCRNPVKMLSGGINRVSVLINNLLLLFFNVTKINLNEILSKSRMKAAKR